MKRFMKGSFKKAFTVLGIAGAVGLVPATTQATQGSLGLGYAHTCAVMKGGLQCWGWNDLGQLGNGRTGNAGGPKKVVGLDHGVTRVTGGDSHTCAVVDGGVKCWGNNQFGQLGNGTRRSSPVPTEAEILGPNSGVTDIAGGDNFTCAVVQGGVMCWGWDLFCQIGRASCSPHYEDNKDDVKAGPRWVDGLGPHSGVTKIATGKNHACAVVNGGVMCWGAAFYGKLGDGTFVDSPNGHPRYVKNLGPGSGATDVGLGEDHSCALVRGGVMCWGHDYLTGTNKHKHVSITTPIWVNKLGEGHDVRILTASINHTCAATSSKIYCWGNGTTGELGAGNFWSGKVALEPVLVNHPASKILEVSAGRGHTCANFDGKIKCWGWNTFCQVGNGQCGGINTAVASPVEVVDQ